MSAEGKEQVPDDVRGQLGRFSAALEKLEKLVDSTLSTSPKELNPQFTALQRARTHFATAQGLHHTFLLYLRTQGLVTKGHPINKEGERIKVYAKKLRALESALYVAKYKPSTEVNIAAANRFISHSIPDLSREQKDALKEVGQKRKAPSSSVSIAGSDPAQMARAFLEQTFKSQQAPQTARNHRDQAFN